jgi:hypothetical protein
LKGDDPAAAKRHLLDALADSPRYREAHGMLIEIVDGRPTTPAATPPAASPVPAPAPAPSTPKEEPKEKQIPLPGDKPTPAPQ